MCLQERCALIQLPTVQVEQNKQDMLSITSVVLIISVVIVVSVMVIVDHIRTPPVVEGRRHINEEILQNIESSQKRYRAQ